MSEFKKGDRVKIVRDSPSRSYARYDLLGCIGKITGVHGDKTASLDLEGTPPDKWKSPTCNGVFQNQLEKQLNNGFFNGDKVKVNGASHNYKGLTGVIEDAVNNPDIVRIKPDNGDPIIGLRKAKVGLIEESENNVAPELTQVFHCFFIKNNGAEFDKLGDFNLTPSGVNDYLYDKYGEGSYLYKQKNEKTGKIVTLKAPDTPKCEVLEGIQ